MRERADARALVAVGGSGALPERRRIRVLCVEDDPEDLFLIRRALAALALHEAEVAVAMSLGEALELFAAERFDVCLCDFWLGSETTMPLIEEARRSLSGCPVVLMSTIENDDIELIGRRSGSCGFIGKGDLSAAALDRVLATILPRLAAPDPVPFEEEEIERWLHAVIRGLDRIHAASSLALAAPAAPLEELTSQLLADIEADTAEIRQDIVARLLAFEKLVQTHARYTIVDVVPQIAHFVDVVRDHLGARADAVSFIVPRMAIGVEGIPEFFSDLLQGFLAEAAGMAEAGFAVAVQPSIRGERFDLVLRAAGLFEGGDERTLPDAEEKRLHALVEVRRLVVDTLATGCGGKVELGAEAGLPFARLSVPLRR